MNPKIKAQSMALHDSSRRPGPLWMTSTGAGSEPAYLSFTFSVFVATFPASSSRRTLNEVFTFASGVTASARGKTPVPSLAPGIGVRVRR